MNIIFFGNSFTMGCGGEEALKMNGIPGIVKAIADATGLQPPRVQMTATGGVDLAWHLENTLETIKHPSQFESIPADLQWDYCVIQEFSLGPTELKKDSELSGKPQEFLKNTGTLFEHVRFHSPDVKGVLYETWPRCLKKPGFYPSPFRSPSDFQSQLRKYYNQACNLLKQSYGESSALTAPAGDAWEILDFAENLYGKDLYHASNKGSLLNALVIFKTIYSQIPKELELSNLCRRLNVHPADCKELLDTLSKVGIKS